MISHNRTNYYFQKKVDKLFLIFFYFGRQKLSGQ